MDPFASRDPAELVLRRALDAAPAYSVGDAKSLQGGTLLLTPLLGPDGGTYAVAQGAVSIGGAFLGGGGGNAVNRMISSGIDGVQFVAANTDCQALRANRAAVLQDAGSASPRRPRAAPVTASGCTWPRWRRACSRYPISM